MKITEFCLENRVTTLFLTLVAIGGGAVSYQGMGRLEDPGAWELLGGEVAANLLNVAEGAMATLRSAAQGAGSALQRGTAQRYVTRASLSAFLDVLDDTRSRVDRLAQRVRAAESRT